MVVTARAVGPQRRVEVRLLLLLLLLLLLMQLRGQRSEKELPLCLGRGRQKPVCKAPGSRQAPQRLLEAQGNAIVKRTVPPQRRVCRCKPHTAGIRPSARTGARTSIVICAGIEVRVSVGVSVCERIQLLHALANTLVVLLGPRDLGLETIALRAPLLGQSSQRRAQVCFKDKPRALRDVRLLRGKLRTHARLPMRLLRLLLRRQLLRHRVSAV
jgi:hypothetical protein